MRFTLSLAVLFLATAVAFAEDVRHVVLVSVDGLAASYFDDPRAQMPTLRKLAAEGARAKGMITTFPSVTWPSHTSLVTGATAARHGVIGNSVWKRDEGRELVYLGDPELEKDQAIRVPTLYDAAHAAGLKTGSVIWPCSNGAKTLDWVIPDSNKPALHEKYTTPGFIAELKAAGIDIGQLGAWGWDKKRSTERDDLYTRVAIHLLEKHHVNLVLLHLITPDGVEHAYGPHTPEAYQAVAEADANLKRVWDALQRPPLAGKSTLFITSDHGFAPVEKLIRPNVVLKELGLVQTDAQNKPVKRQAWSVAQGGSAFVYLLDDDSRAEALPRVKDALAKVEGIEKLIEPAGFAVLGLPTPDKNPEAPDLVLTTGQGYSFNNDVLGESVGPGSATLKGTHGHLPGPDYMHATFVAVGTGIKPGVVLETVQNIDVAPTIAELLKIALPTAEGRVLKQLLGR